MSLGYNSEVSKFKFNFMGRKNEKCIQSIYIYSDIRNFKTWIKNKYDSKSFMLFAFGGGQAGPGFSGNGRGSADGNTEGWGAWPKNPAQVAEEWEKTLGLRLRTWKCLGPVTVVYISPSSTQIRWNLSSWYQIWGKMKQVPRSRKFMFNKCVWHQGLLPWPERGEKPVAQVVLHFTHSSQVHP